MASNLQMDEVLKAGWEAVEKGRRFIVELSDTEVNEEFLNSLEDYLIIIESMKSDEESSEEKELDSPIKDVLESCYGWGVKLRVRIEAVYGRDSEEFTSFPTEDLNKGRSYFSSMQKAMDKMLPIARSHFDVLAPHGLTKEEIDSGEILQKKLVKIAKHMRYTQISQREKVKEDIFGKILRSAKTVNKTGLTIFKDRPEIEAKFEDNINLL